MNEEIFGRLCASRKYGDVHPDAIRRAVEDAERRFKKPKEIEKAARERLHGITSAFNGLGGAPGGAPPGAPGPAPPRARPLPPGPRPACQGPDPR